MSERREIEIRLRSRSAESSADSLNRKVKGVGQSADNAEASMFKLSKTAIAVGTALAAAGVAKFFLESNSAAKEFNKSMSNLSAITGAVGKDLDFLRETALEFGATTTLSATQAAEALKLVASAKPDLLSNAAALKEVTRQAVLLAEASGGTLQLADAAGVVGKALNQFSEDADQAARFVNVLAAGAKFGSSEVLDTSLALKNAGVAAASAKVSFEETNAAIQVLAKNGIAGAEAGTALRNIFLKLDTDTNSKLRPSVVGLSQALKNLNDLNESGAEQVKRFGLENIVAGKSLVASVDLLGSLTGKLTGTNTALEQASTNVNNLDGDLLALGSAYESLQIKIGSLADGELRQLTQTTTEFIQALNGNVEALNEWGGTLDNIENIALSLAIIFSGRFISSMSAATTSVISKIAANNKLLASEVSLLSAQKASATSAALAAVQTQEAAKRQLANAAATNSSSAAIARLAIANGNVIATQATLTATTNAYTSAALRASVASRGLSAAMALVGGPVGLAVIAAASLVYFVSTADEATTSTNRYSQEVAKLNQNLKNNELAQGSVNNAMRESIKIDIEKKLVDLNARLATQESLAIAATRSSKEMGSGFATASSKAEALRIEIDLLKKSLSSLNNDSASADIDSLLGGESGFELFGFGSAPEATSAPEKSSSGKSGGDTGEASNKAFESLKARLKLETQAIQEEAEVRRAFAEGLINQQQLDEELALQNIYYNYEARRVAIAENEAINKEQKAELLAELALQEIEAEQIKQDQLTEKTQEGTSDRLALEQQYTDAVKSLQFSALSNAVTVINKLTGESKAAAIIGIGIQTASAFVANQVATASAATLAFSSQLIPGDPTSIARATAAAAKATSYGQFNGGLILAAGAANAIGATSGGGGGSGGSSASSPTTTSQFESPIPVADSQSQSRVINITGLDGFGDDQPIPLTIGGLRDLLSSNEDVNIAINNGQQNAARIGAI